MFLYYRHKRLNTSQKKSHVNNRISHLANERTFLAWIRTSVAIMAFGFLVEKFSLFLRIEASRYPTAYHPLVDSDLLGILFIGLGGMIGFLAILRYIHTEKDIENNVFRPSIIIDVLFALIFLILTTFLCFYIVNGTDILKRGL